MLKALEACEVCPHACKINRNRRQKGRCRCDDKILLALASIHHFEEPCISGENGSGTVFFSNCNLSCQFCQNYQISQLGKGNPVTISRYFYQAAGR